MTDRKRERGKIRAKRKRCSEETKNRQKINMNREMTLNTIKNIYLTVDMT